MTRAAATLVLVTRTQVVRADYAAGARRRALVRRERPAQGDLADAVEGALLGERPGKRVWVLASELWLQTQPLPTGAASLPRDEVAAALRFEAEALSGLAATESVVAYTHRPDAGSDVLLVQASTSQQARLEARLARLGGALAGALHPAGLPGPFGDAGETGWVRVELWSDAIVVVAATPAAPARVHVINESPLRGAWEAEVEAWLGAAGAGDSPRTLLLAEGADAGAASEPALDLDTDDVALGGWLDAWADVLSRRDPGVPVLGPGPRPASAHRQVALAAGLGVVAAALCFGHHRLIEARRREMMRERERLEAPAKELARLRQATSTAERRLKELEAERREAEARLRDRADVLVLQRRRHMALLEAVARRHDPSLVVEQVKDAAGVVELTGLCVQPGAANDLAAALQRDLAREGWQVQPAEVHVEQGRCRFTIPVVSTARSTAPSPATVAAPARGRRGSP